MNAIEIKNVSKKYSRHRKRRPVTSLKSYFLYDLWHRREDRDKDTIWALKDVSLNVEKGITLGIIGRNGSGKSTLLKLISRILKPDKGTITVEGKVAALIELGAGFHPELSGRENVIINGIILGFSKNQMKDKFDEIVNFAEMGEYVDDPVRTYSSGMYMRLAFSVAIHTAPDILIIDEILAVGDENFQTKCLDKVRNLKKSGRTILIVSHDIRAIEQMCDEVCLLDKGACLQTGKSTEVVASYHRLLGSVSQMALDMQGQAANRWGNREAEITRVSFIQKDGQLSAVFKTNEPFKVQIVYNAPHRIELPVFGLAIHREEGSEISGSNTKTSRFQIDSIEGAGIIEFQADVLPLLPGRYLVTAVLYDSTCLKPYDHWDKHFSFTVIPTDSVHERQTGFIYLKHDWRHLL